MYDEYDEARWFLTAAQRALADAQVPMRRDPVLERQLLDLIVGAAREHQTLRETIARFVAFVKRNHMLDRALTASFADDVEIIFATLRPTRMAPLVTAPKSQS